MNRRPESTADARECSMGFHKWNDIKARKYTPEKVAELDAQVRRELMELDLRELRRLAKKTQIETAALMKTTQSELSKVERRDDHRLSTLRKYVEALGGEVE